MGEVRNRGKNAIFTVRNLADINKLIKILSKYTLNSKKYLDFLDFKKAFELYTSTNLKTSEMLQEVHHIKDCMNKGRINFDMPRDHVYRITPY